MVLVSFDEHLGSAAWCSQLTIVHQRCEDSFRLWLLGLSIPKEATELGNTVHGAAAGVGQLFLLPLHNSHVSAAMVTDAVHYDSRKDGPHDESQNNSNGQQGDWHQLIMTLQVALTNHSCNKQHTVIKQTQDEEKLLIINSFIQKHS